MKTELEKVLYILARMLLSRLLKHFQQDHLPERQHRLRAGRGTIDMIFAAQQIQEKTAKQSQDLYIAFIDLSKAFDTMSRDGLWNIMSKIGCQDRFVNIVKLFHDGMMAQVS